MNLILGVVVSIAQTEHDNLKKEIEEEEGFEKMADRQLLIDICADMDDDGSGELTRQELMHGYHNRPDFRDHLDAIEVTADDLTFVFSKIDPDKSGTVTYTELVKEIYRM